MRKHLRKIGSNILHSDTFMYTFLRSAASSQTSGWVDLVTGFVLFAWAGFSPFLSAALGAVAGGVVNCIMNYKFTFHAQNCPWSAVVVKYFMVWTGSLLLNSFGTQIVYYSLQKWHWLDTLGFKPDGYYAAARLGVSLAVSWFWNFLLQRNFVYQPTRFDKYASAFVHYLNPKYKKKDLTN